MKEFYGGKTKAGTLEKKEKIVKQGDIKKKLPGQAYKILVKPLITEKAANLGSENKYVFEVSVSTNKIEIAKAINEVYGVKPVSVNIVNVGGKKVRYGRHFGKRKDTKKAIITLPKGKTINIYEGV
ncbi:50S ribosomal protein L23 [bacterium]|nr:50S ribosomal protein L23 [bacterium]